MVVKGLLIERGVLTPYADRSYRSIIRKSENVFRHLSIIEETRRNILSSLPTIEPGEADRLICSLQDFCENIYSCMDYLSQILRQEYKKIYRGSELPDGFNSILKGLIKDMERPADKKKEIYKDGVLSGFILKSKIWYEVVHSIRTEETHYGMGEILAQEKSLIYKNQNRSGDSEDITFDVSNAQEIFFMFCDYINELDKLVINLNS